MNFYKDDSRKSSYFFTHKTDYVNNRLLKSEITIASEIAKIYNKQENKTKMLKKRGKFYV